MKKRILIITLTLLFVFGVFICIAGTVNNNLNAGEPTEEECRGYCAAFFPIGTPDYNDCVYCCSHDCE